jgi:DNA repair protein SbcC/Rad50
VMEQLATLGPAGEAVEHAGAEHGARSESAREAALRLGHADPEDLARLAVPTHAGAQSLASRFERLATERQRQQAQAEELSRQRTQAETRLAAEVATEEVPTETGLADARADRDAVLRWLYRGWLDDDEAARRQLVERAGAPGASAVVAATGAAVTRADAIADALRVHAVRVEGRAALARELEHISQQEAALVEAQGALTRDAAALASEWQALLSPLAIGEASPESLLEWLDRHRDFLQRYEQARAARQRLDNARGDLERLLGVLDDALARFGLEARSAGESPLTALARLKALQTDLQQTESQRLLLASRRDDASRNLQELTPRMAEAEAALSRWEGHWSEAMEAIDLSPDSLSAEAEARLDRCANLEAAVTDVDACAARMATYQQTLAAFPAEVGQLADALGEALPEDGAAAVARVETWHAWVAEAQAAREQARQLDGDIEALDAAIGDARRTQHSAEATLALLCRDAGVTDVAALPAIEQQVQARSEALTRLEKLETELRTQFGKSVEELVAEAEGHTLDVLGVELEALGQAIAEADTVVGQRHEALFHARQRFEEIDGSEQAACAAQEQSAMAAEIGTLARRWVRVRLADTLLGQVVESWRARHQGPLLERASAIFARLTLGSFEGLTTDYNDDRQHLLGRRPDGDTLGVAGMSQGTRDQLFLALRLATIESHIASRGPFPVIADDLLVQFDDDRALATLEELLELSRRTQVLLFTHHRHLQQVVERAGLAQQITLSCL